MTLVVLILGAVGMAFATLLTFSLGVVARKPMPLPHSDGHTLRLEEAA